MGTGTKRRKPACLTVTAVAVALRQHYSYSDYLSISWSDPKKNLIGKLSI